MDIPLNPDEITKQLWSAYKKTPKYKQGLQYAIPEHHQLVEKQEKLGLKMIYKQFVEDLLTTQNSRNALKKRTIDDWLDEWKGMHKMLFGRILVQCGTWRKIDVRFGAPGDEDLHRIPNYREVPREIAILVHTLRKKLQKRYSSDEERYAVLAKIHYGFVRIHPFFDGNGRIARAITDQLAIFFNFPPAMAGYPRHDSGKRILYHKAIHSCISDPSCKELASWIAGYIKEQLELLA